MKNAYFTNIRKEISSLLSKSHESVHIAMAWFTCSELFNELIRGLERGVKIELILLDHPINWQPYAPKFKELIDKGGEVRIYSPDSGQFLHHKFCIIDTSIVITGSYNWTYYAESRNLENIVVSDDIEIVNKFQSEFQELKNRLKIRTNIPQLEWKDLEQMHDINFSELNYEIEKIAISQKLPKRTIIKSNTVVEVVEKRFNPTADANIGIQADKDSMIVLIPEGAKLPYTGRHTFYNYSDNRQSILCSVVCGKYVNASQNTVILERDVTELTNKSEEWELQFVINATLDTNAYLHIEIRCVEMGKALDLITVNPKIVNYDN